MNPLHEVKNLERKAAAILDWHHVILYLALVVVLFSASYFWSAQRAATADARTVLAEARYAEAQKQNVVLQQQIIAQVNALKQQNDALAAQNKALNVAIAAREQRLNDRQRQDRQLPPAELAERWSALLQRPGSVTATSAGYEVTPPAAQETILALEELPVRRVDVQDLQRQVANLETVIVNDAKMFDLEKQARASDQAVCTAGLAAKDAEIKKVKADAARAKRRWGIVGFILGTLVRNVAFR